MANKTNHLPPRRWLDGVEPGTAELRPPMISTLLLAVVIC